MGPIIGITNIREVNFVYYQPKLRYFDNSIYILHKNYRIDRLKIIGAPPFITYELHISTEMASGTKTNISGDDLDLNILL